MPVGDGQHDRLQRREPQRKCPGIVLDEHRDEALEAAEDGPMDDHRPVVGVVGARVLQIEPLRQLVVELDRRALPLPADRIRDVEVDLRPVERAVAFVERVGLPGLLERLLQRRPRRDPTSRLRQGTPPGAWTASPSTPARSRRRHAAPASAALPPPTRSDPPARSSAHRPARTGGRASVRTARLTLRCGAAASARAGESAGRGSCAPRLPKTSMWPGQFIALTPICSSPDSTRNMFWR